MPWFVYLLQCGNGDLYTGMTSNLQQRLKDHQSGKGGWFTKTTQPVTLVYQEQFATEAEARRREAQLKGWSRQKKLALISGDLELLKKA